MFPMELFNNLPILRNKKIEVKAVEIQNRRGKLRTLVTRFDNALDIWNERKRGIKDKSQFLA